jgi:arylsulfatase
VPEPVAVNVRNRSHAITVRCEVGRDTVPSGVLIAQGSALGGWSLHVLDGRLRYVHNLYGKDRYGLDTDTVLTSGRHTVRFAFEKNERRGGDATIAVDGTVVAEGPIARFTPSGFNGVGVGLTCGYEWGPAVGQGYVAPFPFNGTILDAVVEATGPVVRDPLAEIEAIMSEQ